MAVAVFSVRQQQADRCSGGNHTAGTRKLKATKTALEANMRFPGQYFDEESNLSYNYFRSYNGVRGGIRRRIRLASEGATTDSAMWEGIRLAAWILKG